MFDEWVFASDLCPPGLMCKLDCPWLNMYLFVSLGGRLVIGREQPVLANLQKYYWEPGGTHLKIGYPQECVLVVGRDFVPKVDPELINRLSDLVNRFRLVCVFGGDMSFLCVPRGYLTGSYHNRPCWSWEYWLSQVFTLMCLNKLYIQEVTQYGPFSRDNGRTLTDRWIRVLWLAAIRDAGGGPCGSSKQQVSAHHRTQTGRQGGMYLDCVYSAGIS